MSGVSGVGDKKSLSKSADIKIGLRAHLYYNSSIPITIKSTWICILMRVVEWLQAFRIGMQAS